MRKSNGIWPRRHPLLVYVAGRVAETDLAGTTKSEYIFFDGERVARRDGVNGAGGVFYYFSDHLKTASIITDAAGTIKAESDYYPWGGELQFVNNDSNHYKFTSKERDGESGPDYFGARYYSNGLGRWVSADWSTTPVPVPYADFGDPQTLNLYTYARNLPTTKTDIDGHWPFLTLDDFLHAGQKMSSAASKVADFVNSMVSSLPHGETPGLELMRQRLQECPNPPNQKQDSSKQNNNNSQSSNAAEQGRDAQGRFTSKQPGQSSPGSAAEQEALDGVGATKNTEPIPRSNRIPDGTIGDVTNGGQYVEVKSGASISNTAQLRQMLEQQ